MFLTITRAYLLRCSYQPFKPNSPKKEISGALHQFSPDQFKEYKNWLKQMIKKDDAFCLYCYLFRQDVGY